MESLLRSGMPEGGAAVMPDSGSGGQHRVKAGRTLINGAAVPMVLGSGVRYVQPWDFILVEFDPEYQPILKGR
ncbi:MAG: hypothetical protein NZT92_00445 [Abditibacteriales bacterium]|nr:hypothetical protein [Abditibacteriales bacterium]MDW8364312.1 hypothetical protein [Abditibacteriales bacterium]